MYSKDKLLAEDKSRTLLPGLDSIIWRYMSIHEVATLLEERRLMFRQFKDLEKSDKREGMIPEGFVDACERAKRKESPSIDIGEWRRRGENNMNHHRHEKYVCCWNWSDSENALMWMSYAPRGVAIKTTIGKLTSASFKNQEQFGSLVFEGVVYADDWADLERRGFCHNGIFRCRLFLNLKRKLFESEREVRFRIDPRVTCATDTDIQRRPPGRPEQWPVWFPVTFNDLSWIDEVVADSALAPWSVDTLANMLKRHKLQIRQSGR